MKDTRKRANHAGLIPRPSTYYENTRITFQTIGIGVTELSVRGSEKAAVDAVAAVHDAVMVEGPIGKRDEALYSGFQFLYSPVNVYFKYILRFIAN